MTVQPGTNRKATTTPEAVGANRDYGVTRALDVPFRVLNPMRNRATYKEERVMKIIYWIGIDDHADKWTIAQYRGEEARPSKELELVPDEKGYKRLLAYLKGLDGEVRIVYEAGPCGYELDRRLTKAGYQCQGAATALTPRKPAQRVKTNRPDSRKLGGHLRLGEMAVTTVTRP